MTFHFEFQAQYKQSVRKSINNIILIFKKMKSVNQEKAEYRSVRQRILRKEEQKEKLQNRDDI